MRISSLCAFMGLAAIAGCQSQPQELALGPNHETAFVALGLMDDAPITLGADSFILGAGDALGREMFVVYVASIESDAYYATGESDFIEN